MKVEGSSSTKQEKRTRRQFLIFSVHFNLLTFFNKISLLKTKETRWFKNFRIFEVKFRNLDNCELWTVNLEQSAVHFDLEAIELSLIQLKIILLIVWSLTLFFSLITLLFIYKIIQHFVNSHRDVIVQRKRVYNTSKLHSLYIEILLSTSIRVIRKKRRLNGSIYSNEVTNSTYSYPGYVLYILILYTTVY